MAVVGVIHKGTIEGLLDSLEEKTSDSILLTERDDYIGRIIVRGGVIRRAFVTSLSQSRTLFEDQQAIAELKDWQQGLYSLITWGSFDELSGARLLIVSEEEQEAELEEHFAAEGFKSDVVARHDELVEVAQLLRPDVVVITCPRPARNITCEQVRAELEGALDDAPPLVITASQQCEREDCPHLAIKERCEREQGRSAEGYSSSRLCRSKPISPQLLSSLIEEFWCARS